MKKVGWVGSKVITANVLPAPAAGAQLPADFPGVTVAPCNSSAVAQLSADGHSRTTFAPGVAAAPNAMLTPRRAPARPTRRVVSHPQ